MDTTRPTAHVVLISTLMAGLLVALATGCDVAGHGSDEPTGMSDRTVTWRGIHFVAEGDARLSAEDGLRVEGEPGTSRLIIETPGIRGADFLFSPVAISSERPFSIDLVGTDLGGETAILSGVVHQQRNDGRFDLQKAFGRLQPTSITVECRLGNNSVFSREHLLSASQDTFFTSTSDNEPTSFHYYEDDDTIVVEVDYDDDGGEGDGGEENPERQPFYAATMEFITGETTRCTHVAFQMTGMRAGFEKIEGIEMAGLSHLYLREANAR